MKWNEYQETFDDVTVPEDLKQKTIALMNASKKEKKPFLRFLKPLVPIVGVFALIIVFVWNQNNEVDKNFSNESSQEEVAKDGEIKFDEVDQIVKNKSFSALTKQGSMKDAESFFRVLPKYTGIENFEREDKVSLQVDGNNLSFDKDSEIKNVIVATTFTKKEQVINVTFMKTKSTTIKTNSKIKGIDVNLTHSKDEDAYNAEFVVQGVYYSVISDSFSEEEFVSFLENVLNSL